MVVAVDRDSGRYGEVRYSLSGPTAQLFAIDPQRVSNIYCINSEDHFLILTSSKHQSLSATVISLVLITNLVLMHDE